MLKSIRLKNFRSHTDNLFEFEGVVSIEGLNDAGKTSVYRALERTLLGTSFTKNDIQRGEKSCELEAVFSDGRRVYRKYNGTKTTTTLTDSAGKSEEYATAKNLDVVIQEFTGIKKTATPLQMVGVRDDPYFLLNNAQSSTILKQVNSLSYTSAIEAAMQSILSDVRSIKNSQIPSHRKRIEELPTLEALQSAEEEVVDILRKFDTDFKDTDKVIKDDEQELERQRKICADYRHKSIQYDAIDFEAIEALKLLFEALDVRKENLDSDTSLLNEFKDSVSEYLSHSSAVSSAQNQILVLRNKELERQAAVQAQNVCPKCGEPL